MTTITIERSLLEQALNALLLPCDRWNAAQHKIVTAAADALLTALAAPATAPPWQDAPTVPGLWVRNSCDCIGAYLIHESAIPILQGSRSRWFGPLPEDKQ